LLLLLSDSALPIGSFAFSSGLESFVQHLPTSSGSSQDILYHFLRESLRSLAYTTLPFVNAAHSDTSDAVSLDDHFDATTTCPVARRASLAQGKALLTIWEKAFLEDKSIAEEYRLSVKSGTGGHFGVAWGVVCGHCNISKGDSLNSTYNRAMHVCLLTESRESSSISGGTSQLSWSVPSTINPRSLTYATTPP
jgi:urease accessory protein